MRMKKLLAVMLAAGMAITSLPCGSLAGKAAESMEPVMKVTFDDAAATDVTGRGNDGTLVGEPEFVKGVKGRQSIW